MVLRGSNSYRTQCWLSFVSMVCNTAIEVFRINPKLKVYAGGFRNVSFSICPGEWGG